jgi:hypothetical protein
LLTTKAKLNTLLGAKLLKSCNHWQKTTYPDMTPDETSPISSHSGRVWTVVLLNKAGKSPDFIKS